jgi:hypothetical protein
VAFEQVFNFCFFLYMSIAIKLLKTMYINHIFRKPTVDELSAVSQKLGLNVNDKELSEYQGMFFFNYQIAA